ncbi:MAG: penicillin-binding transpeptidase domain-containing protein [Desulfobacterales bacterium]|jgi:cell division protein FtsI/penicillin-binding protein 2|nr:penicillin-binding transpeptidase domain-containing protein [Desulfobacterales bacterium]
MMALNPKIDLKNTPRMDWRTAQRLYQRKALVRRKLVPRVVCLAVLTLLIWGGQRYLSDVMNREDSLVSPVATDKHIGTKLNSPLTKSDIQTLLVNEPITNLTEQSFTLQVHGTPVHVDTSLDLSLQQFLLDRLKGSISRHTGMVVLEPATGRILAMVGFNKQPTDINPCLDSQFPAASVFKIVTASAALEAGGLNPDSALSFNGGKYTLYKTQLKENNSRYTSRTSLKDAFAQSINPVFGKLGCLRLGQSVLTKYADAFGFNRQIDFEAAIQPSSVTLTDERYQLAEIASGFNRRTTLSPLHGALIAAAIVNGGQMPEPTIIDSITEPNGTLLYRGGKFMVGPTIRAETCDQLQQLMQGTIRSGTCRKAFRGYQKDRVLSQLAIGGKTGSIDNQTRDARIDWFVGFAEEKNGQKAIALAIVVAHEDYIGTRANEYAKMVIKHYFNDYFSARRATPQKSARS